MLNNLDLWLIIDLNNETISIEYKCKTKQRQTPIEQFISRLCHVYIFILYHLSLPNVRFYYYYYYSIQTDHARAYFFFLKSFLKV